jgi:hypothetical protein
LSESAHIEVLRHGPKAWNAWREQNPGQIPNLDGAALTLGERQLGPINGGPVNLHSAHLRRAFLRSAALSKAELESADLFAADLTYARLDGANFKAANLSHAVLDYADLSGAILTKTNLKGTDLRYVKNLTRAQIDDSFCDSTTVFPAHLDFRGAKLSKVNLCGAFLRQVKNRTQFQLEESTRSPSTILPLHFQRSVPSSPAMNSTTERYHFRAPTRMIADPGDTHSTPCTLRRPDLNDRQRWGLTTIATSVALIITVFLWQRANETAATALEGQRRFEQSTAELSLPPTAKSAFEHRGAPNATATVDEESDAELQANQLTKAMETSEPDPHGRGKEATLVLTEIPPAAWPHAIIPRPTAGIPSSAALPLLPVRNPIR